MSSYFEGWYFKHQKQEETLAIIAGRAQDSAFVQVVTPQRAYRARYPLESYRKGKALWIGGNCFSSKGICLSIRERNFSLTGTLRYSGLTPIDGDIMGPFQYLPMQCRHAVLSMNHWLKGQLLLNGQVFDFTGGKGYIEGDSGRSFPKSYTWVQCNDFERDCSIMASVAHIPFLFSWFWGCICVVWLEGVEYRLATYHGAKIKHCDANGLLIEQKDLSLYVRFLQPCTGHWLDAPERGRMTRRIREAPCAPALFELRQNGKILFREESRFASCEHVN